MSHFLMNIARAMDIGLGTAGVPERPNVRIEFTTLEAAVRFLGFCKTITQSMSAPPPGPVGQMMDPGVPFTIGGATFVVETAPPAAFTEPTPLGIVSRALVQAYENGRDNHGYHVGRHASIVLDAVLRAAHPNQGEARKVMERCIDVAMFYERTGEAPTATLALRDAYEVIERLLASEGRS